MWFDWECDSPAVWLISYDVDDRLLGLVELKVAKLCIRSWNNVFLFIYNLKILCKESEDELFPIAVVLSAIIADFIGDGCF